MNRFLPKENDIWQHADGSKWIVIKAAVNEDRQLEITIAALDFSFRIEKWDINEFLDEVDTDNYPDCTQKHVFEFVSPDDATVAENATVQKRIELVEE